MKHLLLRRTHAQGLSHMGIQTLQAMTSHAKRECLSVSMCQPCDGLPICPGCTPPLAQKSAGIGSSTLRPSRISGHRRWMSECANLIWMIPEQTKLWGSPVTFGAPGPYRLGANDLENMCYSSISRQGSINQQNTRSELKHSKCIIFSLVRAMWTSTGLCTRTETEARYLAICRLKWFVKKFVWNRMINSDGPWRDGLHCRKCLRSFNRWFLNFFFFFTVELCVSLFEYIVAAKPTTVSEASYKPFTATFKLSRSEHLMLEKKILN